MEEHRPMPQAALPAEPEVIRPPSIWLTQIWLGFQGVLYLAGGLWACFGILRGIVTQPASLQFNREGLFGLLMLAMFIGIGTLVTVWALQKRKRIGRWCALYFVGLTIAKIFLTEFGRSAYLKLFSGETSFFVYEAIVINLIQVIFLYRFAFGKSERAFLSQ